jgi:excisionase family DNA binding protein
VTLAGVVDLLDEFVKQTPRTYGEMKAWAEEKGVAAQLHDAASRLLHEGRAQRVVREGAKAVFAKPGTKIEGRKKEHPGLPAELAGVATRGAASSVAVTHVGPIAVPPAARVPVAAAKSIRKPPAPVRPEPPVAPAAVEHADLNDNETKENIMRDEDAISAKEAAKRLGVSVSRVAQLVNAGDLKGKRGGGRGRPLVIDRESVVKYLARGEAQTPAKRTGKPARRTKARRRGMEAIADKHARRGKREAPPVDLEEQANGLGRLEDVRLVLEVVDRGWVGPERALEIIGGIAASRLAS